MAEIERTCDFLPLVVAGHEEDDQPMFTIDCPTHGTEVLLSERRIEAVVPTEEGHELRWRCWCGTTGSTFVRRLSSAQLMVGRHRTAV